MSHFDLPITKGSLETLDTLQNRSLHSKYKLIEVLPWVHTHTHTHIYDMRVQLLDKERAMGGKVWTHWELDGNTTGSLTWTTTAKEIDENLVGMQQNYVFRNIQNPHPGNETKLDLSSQGCKKLHHLVGQKSWNFIRIVFCQPFLPSLITPPPCSWIGIMVNMK